jgi:type IV pilus assembly protein PilA
MDRIYKMMKRDSKGFTLVELMVVLLIIGILVAIAIPIFNNAQKDAANKAHAANMRTLLGAAQQALAVEGVPDDEVIWDSQDSSKVTGDEDEEVTYAASDYITEWPDVPKKATDNPEFAENSGKDKLDKTKNYKYQVVIKDDGDITVAAEETSL